MADASSRATHARKVLDAVDGACESMSGKNPVCRRMWALVTLVPTESKREAQAFHVESRQGFLIRRQHGPGLGCVQEY